MRTRPLIAALALAGSTALAGPVLARPLHSYQALAFAPAGDRIADVESDAQPDAAAEPHGVVVIRAAASGRILQRLDPCKTCDYSGLTYADDGRLAFVATDHKAGTARLMVATGARARTIASVDGLINKPRWSPDGRRIAILATIGAQKLTGATQPGVRQVGEIGEHEDEQRIAIVPATGGAPHLVSPADRFVYEYDWAPDGQGFVATSAKGNGDANWWVATLDWFGADGTMRVIANPPMQMNQPRVSPDGRTVSFIGGLMSDFGSVGGDVYAVPVAGGTPRDLTSGYKGTFTSLLWDKGGLRATALIGDQEAVVPIDPAGGPGAPIWTAPVTTSAGDGRVAYARNGVAMAMVAQDFEHPPTIFAGPTGHPVQLSHDNDGFPAIARARSIAWKDGGFDVQGWLVAPAGAAAPAGKAPMVTIVHGGPAAANTPSFLWDGTTAALLHAGYWLFLPNPRGSYGQGEAFTQANRRDFGGGDLKDILAGIDAAEKAAPIDDNRLALMGGSYGGFMAMWTNTQTNRFKAIYSAAGLSDWISYYGTNGINTWMIPYFGKSAYDDFDIYWEESPIKHIRQAHTPTLITVGELDIEVPPTQSVEYWNGLKAMGVPTSLVIYPGEGHGIRQPEHQADARRRLLAWFGKYLGR